MKKISILIITTCIALFSCKKESDNTAGVKENTSDKKTKFNISVADFVSKVESLPGGRIAQSANQNAKDSTLYKKVQFIVYRIYDNSQTLVSSYNQFYNINPSTFGTYSDSLKNGSYTVVIAASVDSIPISNDNNLNTVVLSARYNDNNVMSSWSDLFAKKQMLTISQTTTTTDLSLDRIVSKLDINLADATYPLYQVSAQIIGDYDRFNLNTFTPALVNPTAPTLALKRTNDTTFSSLVMNTTNDFSLKISVRNTESGVIMEKVIDNIRCYPNKKTVVSGKIESFDTHYPRSIPTFSIKVENAWETDGPVINY